MVNRTDQPIDEIHVTEAKESIDEVKFDRAFKNKLSDKEHFYEIYTLDEPLKPGETHAHGFQGVGEYQGIQGWRGAAGTGVQRDIF